MGKGGRMIQSVIKIQASPVSVLCLDVVGTRRDTSQGSNSPLHSTGIVYVWIRTFRYSRSGDQDVL